MKIAIVLDGGLVQSVYCDDPTVKVATVIDYDTEGLDKEDLVGVDGADAYIHNVDVQSFENRTGELGEVVSYFQGDNT